MSEDVTDMEPPADVVWRDEADVDLDVYTDNLLAHMKKQREDAGSNSTGSGVTATADDDSLSESHHLYKDLCLKTHHYNRSYYGFSTKVVVKIAVWYKTETVEKMVAVLV